VSSHLPEVFGYLDPGSGSMIIQMIVGGVAAVGVIWSGIICASIIQAANAAGGSVNPVTALALGSMDAPSDAHEVYATVDGEELSASIYRPSDNGDPAPVMVYIHGGGWIIGAEDELGHDMRWFADRGWLVISVEYRLATEHRPTWDKAPADVACALSWSAANSPRWGGDPERLVLAGDSAGGNLAVNLAYGVALGPIASSCGGTVPVPDAVVVQYPVVDPLNAYDEGYPARGFEPQMFTERYLGGTPADHPDRLRAISSRTYVSARAPQTLVIEPDRDGFIPSSGVFDWADEARAAGADVSVVPIPYSNHVYNQFAANSLGNQARLTVTESYLEAVQLAP